MGARCGVAGSLLADVDESEMVCINSGERQATTTHSVANRFWQEKKPFWAGQASSRDAVDARSVPHKLVGLVECATTF